MQRPEKIMGGNGTLWASLEMALVFKGDQLAECFGYINTLCYNRVSQW